MLKASERLTRTSLDATPGVFTIVQTLGVASDETRTTLGLTSIEGPARYNLEILNLKDALNEPDYTRLYRTL